MSKENNGGVRQRKTKKTRILWLIKKRNITKCLNLFVELELRFGKYQS